MDPIVHQVADSDIDGALALDAIEADEGRALDYQGEMAFAAAVVAGVPDVAVALVVEFEASRSKPLDEALLDLGGDRCTRFWARAWGGGDAVHLFYIGR